MERNLQDKNSLSTNLFIPVLNAGLACLVFLLNSIHGYAEEFFPFTGEITASQVHVRAGPSKNFESLCQLDQGTSVIVVGKDYSWYKIKLPAQGKSFINHTYVKVHSPQFGEVTGSRVNVRAGTGENFSSLGKLGKGTKFRIAEKVNEWYRLEPLEGIYAWVSEEFVNFKSRDIPPPRVVTLPTRSIYPRRTIPVALPAPAEEPPKEKFFLASGTINFFEEAYPHSKPYKLVTADAAGYTLEGNPMMLKEFLNCHVLIEGKLENPSRLQSSYPLLEVKRIALIL